MMQKSVKMPIFLPVNPEGPKDCDLDPSAKIGWSIFDPRSYHSSMDESQVRFINRYFASFDRDGMIWITILDHFQY